MSEREVLQCVSSDRYSPAGDADQASAPAAGEPSERAGEPVGHAAAGEPSERAGEPVGHAGESVGHAGEPSAPAPAGEPTPPRKSRLLHFSGAMRRPGAFDSSRLPPVAEVAVISMALAIVGGIYMAAHLPARPPLGVAEALTCLAAAAVFANIAQLLRISEFSWSSFFLVAKWALLAYLVIAGMLEFVFVFDGTRGASLVLLTCMLAIFALDVPMLLAFSVARYQAALPAAKESA